MFDVGNSGRRGVTSYHSPLRVASLLRGFWARSDPAEHTSTCAWKEARGCRQSLFGEGGRVTIKKKIKKSVKIMRHHPLSRHFVCLCVCVCVCVCVWFSIMYVWMNVHAYLSKNAECAVGNCACWCSVVVKWMGQWLPVVYQFSIVIIPDIVPSDGVGERGTWKWVRNLPRVYEGVVLVIVGVFFYIERSGVGIASGNKNCTN